MAATGSLQDDLRHCYNLTTPANGRSPLSREADSDHPLAITQFRARGPNGRSRISLTQEDPSVGVQYAGELLAAFIERAGGSIKGEISTGSVPEGLEPVYVHRQSRILSEILTQMLLGSNNYIANQVFLEIGAHRLGGPVSLEKSLQVAREILADHDLPEAIHVEEGSGISRGNRFTARGLAELLHHFAPHTDLLREDRGGSRYKTGTLPGVRTLAGYASTSKHGNVRFVVSLAGNTAALSVAPGHRARVVTGEPALVLASHNDCQGRRVSFGKSAWCRLADMLRAASRELPTEGFTQKVHP